jgi:zinc protease
VLRKITLLLVLPLALSVSASAAPAGSAADDAVLRATLANGLRVIVVPDHLAPVVTTELNYLVGANETPPGFPGMAHALEHMMFRGTADLSAAQLAAISAALGGDFNADTQQTVTQYFFTVPNSQLDVALHIEADRMNGLLATQKLWSEERGAIEQEVARDLSSPQYVLFTKLRQQMFAGTPYAEDALGTRPSFEKTTGEALARFYHQWYAPNNAVLIVAGDVNPPDVVDTVRRLFGPIESEQLPQRPTVTLQPLQPNTFRSTTDLPYGLAVVAYRMPGSQDPGYAAATILADVLSSARGDLYGLVPAGKALYAGFSFDPLPKAGLGYAIGAFPKGGDPEALVSELKSIVAGYAKNGVPADLVEAAKRHEVVDAKFERNSISGLASAWSEAVAVQGLSAPEDEVRALSNVTVGQVNDMLRKWLNNDTATVGILTPSPSGQPTTAKGFGGAENFGAREPATISVPDWAKAAMAVPPVPDTNTHPADMTLPNGLRLIVQPETISDTITLSGEVKSNPDLEAPKGREGVASLLDALFEYGTTTLDRVAFQKAQDDAGVEVSGGSSFGLRSTSGQFSAALHLLADDLLHPRLPEQALTVIRQQEARALAGQLQSPGYLAQRALQTGLYPEGDPALRHPTPQTVQGIDLASVRQYYEKTFRPDMTTIVIAGNVTPEDAKTAVEREFGSWSATGRKPDTALPPVPPNGPSQHAVPDASRVQDEVTLAETLGITRYDDEYYPLVVGNSVLAGGFYATRLYHDLREQAGLVYTVDASVDVGRTRGLYSVEYACDPPNVTKARALAVRDLKQMQDEPVGQEELDRTKALLIHRVPLGESSVSAIAGGLLGRAEMSLPLDENVKAAAKYRATTPADVQAVFRKLIRPEAFVQVTLGPSPQ